MKIYCEYAQLISMSFVTTKFHEIMLSGFRGVALTKKKNQGKDGLTDKQVKNINGIPSTNCCMEYNKFYIKQVIIVMIVMIVNHSLLYSFHCVHLKKKISGTVCLVHLPRKKFANSSFSDKY